MMKEFIYEIGRMVSHLLLRRSFSLSSLSLTFTILKCVSGENFECSALTKRKMGGETKVFLQGYFKCLQFLVNSPDSLNRTCN